MEATKQELIPVSEGELVKLIEKVGYVNVAFGPGGVALIWEKGESMPRAIELLGYMRGVLNENCEGQGI